MTDAAETARVSERISVLEERMKTMDERYDKGWALLREDMAKRDAANTRWMIGAITAAVIVVIGATGLMLTLSG